MSTTDLPHIERPVTLITGGSKGIGLALAEAYADHGYDLVLLARKEPELLAAKEQLERRYACRVIPLVCDLAADDAPQAIARELDARGVRIEALVNNAGTGPYGPVVESNFDELSQMLRINVLGMTALTRLLLPGMIQRGRGHILNVASLVAYFAGAPNWAGYVASKHYVLAFTRGLAKELSGSGVTATALCPGPTATAFVGRSGVGDTAAYRWLARVTPSEVARAGYGAASAGRTEVVPGILNKVLALLGELPPRGLAATTFAALSRDRQSPPDSPRLGTPL